MIEIGRRFGKLVIIMLIEVDGRIYKSDQIVQCKCDCGNSREIPYQRLECGMLLTCGCKLKPRGKKK